MSLNWLSGAMRLRRHWELLIWTAILATGAAGVARRSATVRGRIDNALALRELAQDSTMRAVEPTQLVFMRPRDCPEALNVVDSVIGPADRRIVGVIVVDRRNMPTWRDLAAANRIPFPVIDMPPSRARAALSRIGSAKTPVVVRWDSSSRRLFAIDHLQRVKSAE